MHSFLPPMHTHNLKISKKVNRTMSLLEEEEEALFHSSYPLSHYFVQSPSPYYPNTNNSNNIYIDHPSSSSVYEIQDSPLPSQNKHLVATRLVDHLSVYSSTDISISSITPSQENNIIIKKIYSHEYNNNDVEFAGHEINVRDDDEDDETDERGWVRYFSFEYSNSWWWILLQLSWRALFFFTIGLIIFYVAAKPPGPRMYIKVQGVPQFRLSEGVDGSGVTTKLISCNVSMNLFIDNKSKLFGLHIHPPSMQIIFARLPFASARGRELYAKSDHSTLFKLSVGTSNKPMYGAGRNMQDLLETRKGLPLIIRVKFKSYFYVFGRLTKRDYNHEAQCLVLLGDKYDKKHRTQQYSSTCVFIRY